MTEDRLPRLPSIPAPHRRCDRLQKGSVLTVAEMKARQTAKLRQLADALIGAGFRTLGEQAKVLGLSRSTTWTILNANHKGSGLTAAIANRILAAPRLPQPVRSVLVEYAGEKAAGLYGGSMAQGRQFAARLSIDAIRTVIFEEVDLEHRGTRSDAAPRRGRDGGPHVVLASSQVGNAKRHISLNDHLTRPDAGAGHLLVESWEEKSPTSAKEVAWSGGGTPRRGRQRSRLA